MGGVSSQNRVDPFEIRPESGLGGRWPIRWRPGTSVDGGTRFWPSGFRVYPILAIALKKKYAHLGVRVLKCAPPVHSIPLRPNRPRTFTGHSIQAQVTP